MDNKIDSKIEIDIEIFGYYLDGYIQVFVNDNIKPLIVAHDSNPWNVKYASFKSNGPKIEFFYNCTNNNDTKRKIYHNENTFKSK